MFSHRMKHLFFREQVWIALIFFAKLTDVDQASKVLIISGTIRFKLVAAYKDLWVQARAISVVILAV